MSNAGLIWQADTLDVFLTSSTDKVPGTSMQVAIADNAVRKNVIAYLETLGTAPDGKRGLSGHGNGRYGSAQLGDSTYNATDGSISALHQSQGLLGLVGHATKDLDFFAYHAYEDQGAAYNLVPKDNTACNTPYVSVSALPSTADCGGVGIVRHYVGGFLWKFYKGRLGYIHGGPEIEYITNTTYTARNGTIGRTNDTMFYLTIRYFPFQ
ncbi:MAG TPA: hypothetical protein VGL34_05125 [Steroidobacteraceae bacterium]|jgi:hypothetical protein